jgi:uncharacterized protein YoxC
MMEMVPLLFPVLIFVAVVAGFVIVILGQEKIMATQVTAAQALEDLQAATTLLQGQVTALTSADAAINDAIARLQQELQSGTGVDPAAIEAVVASLQGVSLATGSIVQALNDTAGSVMKPQAPQPSAPSQADLDAVAAEQKAAEATSGADPAVAEPTPGQ